MDHPDTAKPATALHGEPASKIEQLCGRLDNQDTTSPADRQARRLCRLFAVSYATAATLARLAFDCGVPR
jgi:hypothetical protein